jgi:hypothetical protein
MSTKERYLHNKSTQSFMCTPDSPMYSENDPYLQPLLITPHARSIIASARYRLLTGSCPLRGSLKQGIPASSLLHFAHPSYTNTTFPRSLKQTLRVSPPNAKHPKHLASTPTFPIYSTTRHSTAFHSSHSLSPRYPVTCPKPSQVPRSSASHTLLIKGWTVSKLYSFASQRDGKKRHGPSSEVVSFWSRGQPRRNRA